MTISLDIDERENFCCGITSMKSFCPQNQFKTHGSVLCVAQEAGKENAIFTHL